MTNALRQRTYRMKQLEAGRKAVTTYMTDEEHFYLQRVLHQMRKKPTQKPATMRCTVTGRYAHLDT